MSGAGGGEFSGGWRGDRQSDRSSRERQFHVPQPVGSRRDDAHILGEMLERERLDGNGNAVGIDDDWAELAHGFLNSLAVVIDRAVREVSQSGFRGVDIWTVVGQRQKPHSWVRVFEGIASYDHVSC
jgi:hypothetical protein